MKQTEASIRDIYAPLAPGDFKAYMEKVSDDVDWIIGNPELKTFPPAGRYNKAGFMNAIGPLGKCFPGPLRLTIAHILVSEDGKSASVELIADEHGKDGTKFKNFYCWVNEFNDEGVIVAVRAYLDTALVKQLMENNGQA